jgi:hypothetical protein
MVTLHRKIPPGILVATGVRGDPIQAAHVTGVGDLISSFEADDWTPDRFLRWEKAPGHQSTAVSSRST